MKILHVIATPRSGESSSLRVSTALLDALRANRTDIEVEVVDLFNEDLPALAGDNIETKYTLTHGQPIGKDHIESWRSIEALISRFLAVDAYVISTPMWNFGIPYALKYFIDCIVQPGYLFKFNEQHYPVPLVHGKKMICVTSRGSDYSNEMMKNFDFQEPYLRAVFGFVGITDIEFVTVEPTDIPAFRDAAFSAALTRADLLAEEWSKAFPPPLTATIAAPVEAVPVLAAVSVGTPAAGSADAVSPSPVVSEALLDGSPSDGDDSGPDGKRNRWLPWKS